MSDSNAVGNFIPRPKDAKELLLRKDVQPHLTIIDHLTSLIPRVYDNPEYSALTEAILDSQAVNGSTTADDYLVADWIKKFAAENGLPEIAKENVETIKRGHYFAQKRWKIGRRQRRIDDENGEQ